MIGPMKSIFVGLSALAAAMVATSVSAATQVDRAGRPVLEVAQQLKTGQFVWAPELAQDGPLLLIINLMTQRLIVFRNGVPIAASTISTGKPDHETPTGVFTILEKQKVHFSSKYDSAPMPNMQRLTWQGVALHAGHLPGYAASHGCIRLPASFSQLLYGTTRLGMTVVITKLPVQPQKSEPPQLAIRDHGNGELIEKAQFDWHPERSAQGIVSVVISAADQRAIVFRNGIKIGDAPVYVGGELGSGIAYVYRSYDVAGPHWLRLRYSGAGEGMDVAPDEGKKFEAPAGFRAEVARLLSPGSIVIVTPQPLQAGSPGTHVTVIENEQPPN
jgi:L,D-transpeptidase-like protein